MQLLHWFSNGDRDEVSVFYMSNYFNVMCMLQLFVSLSLTISQLKLLTRHGKVLYIEKNKYNNSIQIYSSQKQNRLYIYKEPQNGSIIDSMIYNIYKHFFPLFFFFYKTKSDCICVSHKGITESVSSNANRDRQLGIFLPPIMPTASTSPCQLSVPNALTLDCNAWHSTQTKCTQIWPWICHMIKDAIFCCENTRALAY